ncbi:MAG TPA: DUF1249 domain-containing protein [Candidatus Saccharimonadia bacterium]|nr:DUF1249 domain-containing protein [Candidatus Saccharimonadia bacterium]
MLALRPSRLEIAKGRFAFLMGLYGENYWQLIRLFGADRLDIGRYISRAGDELDLALDVIERHPYTLELKLSYQFRDEATGEPDPSAYVRLYRDARVAEVTMCYVDQRLEDVLGRDADAKTVFDHRLRMNSFLNKWLAYLGERGHSRFTLVAAPATAVS